MITMPDFNEQSMYDAETVFNLFMSQERLAKFIAHWEAMKLVAEVPGCIIECGVFKGTSLSRFALMRQMLGGEFAAKIIGFDVFSDTFPDTEHQQDQKQREHWIETAGGSSIGADQLSDLFKQKGISNFELVPGDVLETVPAFCDENQGLKISLLNVDIDFVEPTKLVLEYFYPKVVQGGIILLDNYAGFGTSGISYHGDTAGVDSFFEDKKVNIKRFSFGARPAYIIKE